MCVCGASVCLCSAKGLHNLFVNCPFSGHFLNILGGDAAGTHVSLVKLFTSFSSEEEAGDRVNTSVRER